MLPAGGDLGPTQLRAVGASLPDGVVGPGDRNRAGICRGGGLSGFGAVFQPLLNSLHEVPSVLWFEGS